MDSEKSSAEWRLADAKNRFSELVTKAIHEGPQRVRRHNDLVIIMAHETYEKLAGKKKNLKEFLLTKGPGLEDVDLTRDPSAMRDVEL